MQRLVRHLGLPAIAAAYVALLCGLTASLILAVGYHDQFAGLKHTIYMRCVQRTAYDMAAHDSAVADLAEQTALVRVLGHRPGDGPLVAIFARKAARDRAVIDRGVIGGCAVYR